MNILINVSNVKFFILDEKFIDLITRGEIITEERQNELRDTIYTQLK